jgi:hypothetical protein
VLPIPTLPVEGNLFICAKVADKEITLAVRRHRVSFVFMIRIFFINVRINPIIENEFFIECVCLSPKKNS